MLGKYSKLYYRFKELINEYAVKKKLICMIRTIQSITTKSEILHIKFITFVDTKGGWSNNDSILM